MRQKSLAEFAARRRQRNKIIFSRDMRVRENTTQAASVEFLRMAQKLCAQQTASLLSEKPGGFFDSLAPSGISRRGLLLGKKTDTAGWSRDSSILPYVYFFYLAF